MMIYQFKLVSSIRITIGLFDYLDYWKYKMEEKRMWAK
jgi:hypothetical protein